MHVLIAEKFPQASYVYFFKGRSKRNCMMLIDHSLFAFKFQ